MAQQSLAARPRRNQPVPFTDVRRAQTPHRLNILLIVDPSESLDAAAEADQLVDMLDTCDNLEVTILGALKGVTRPLQDTAPATLSPHRTDA